MFAEDEARLLLEAADEAGGDDELDALVARRAAGEPLEHVVGWAQLLGRRYPVAPGVFVPRVRSELLVRTAASLVPARGGVVVDLCCGSGALGAAVFDESAAPIELHAADLDPVAVACARPTVAARGGTAYVGDLFDALPATLRGRIDVLVANVPYVATADIATMPAEARDHEPRHTLDGGADGLDLLRRVAAGAPEWLAPTGHLLCEVADHQLDPALAALTAAGLTPTHARDGDLEALVVVAHLPSSLPRPNSGPPQ